MRTLVGNQGFFVDLFSLWCLRIGFKEIFLKRFLETLAGSEDKEVLLSGSGPVCVFGLGFVSLESWGWEVGWAL